MTYFLSGGSKLTVCEPKLTCFKCHDPLTWFLCGWWWSKLTRFWMRAANRLFYYKHRYVHGFRLGGRCWLDFGVGDQA